MYQPETVTVKKHDLFELHAEVERGGATVCT